PDSNPEFQQARSLGLKQTKYAQLLGQVMQERLGIAVSGTHGKSTTTAMTSFALLQCGADPSFVIGGTVPQLGGSSRSGAGRAFVVEACEFDRSFHNYHPHVAIITNIETDHLDCYPGGIEEIIQSFRTFAQHVSPDGLIIANGQDPHVRQALAGLTTRIEWIGLDDPQSLDWSVQITGLEHGCYYGDVYHNGQRVTQIRLGLAGRHNAFNALATLAACTAAGVAPTDAAAALARFTGVDRRMTELGSYNGAILVDDYGHHPTEIRTTLRAIREKYNPARLICIFQPHQHSRTRSLFDQFATAFTDADIVILPDIYAARDSEADKRSVSSKDLVDRIIQNGQRALHLPQFPHILEWLRKEAHPGDLIITMGAGNVCEIGCQLLGR
ncbi:MAG TPA: UDP-N-acetylmuramate--L-alanine ligase, partial [Tepidisphaeraceae bacterium]|nr:UDP-N-acetylmuramate--L-alanine ligase [Tepidisphaeraceae bacterium]